MSLGDIYEVSEELERQVRELQYENRNLKNELTDALEWKIALKESRDELLGTLKELTTKAELLIRNFSYGKASRAYNAIIKKAQALKDKE